MRPLVFIGSTSEQKRIAEKLFSSIEDFTQPRLWAHDVFKPSETTISSLMKETKTSQFAVLLITPDDKVEVRGEEYASPRDNVIFELGLFMGALGANKAFLVRPKTARGLKLPTDLAGVAFVTYDDDRDDGATVNSFHSAAGQIRDAITAALKALPPEYLSRYAKRISPEFSIETQLDDAKAYDLLVSMYQHEKFNEVCTFDIAFHRWQEATQRTQGPQGQTVNLSSQILSAMKSMFTERRCLKFRRIMVVKESVLQERFALEVLTLLAELETRWRAEVPGLSVETRILYYPESPDKEITRKRIHILKDFVYFDGTEGQFAVEERTLGSPDDHVEYPQYVVTTVENAVSDKRSGFNHFWDGATVRLDDVIARLAPIQKRKKRNPKPHQDS
jgi:hypothetical protein